MNRTDLDKRHADAVRRWAPTMRDTGKVPPDLLADLAGIAEEHARDHAENVIARRELREQAATPPLAAADTGAGNGDTGTPEQPAKRVDVIPLEPKTTLRQQPVRRRSR